MKIFRLLKNIGLILFLVLTITACSSSDDGKGGDCITQEDVNRFQSKTEAFSANPTKANCDVVKEAAFDYLNKLKNCSGATEATKTLIEQWRDMDCEVFNSDGGNNGGGNNGGGTGSKEKRDVTFGTNLSEMVGVSVYVKGSLVGTFTKYYSVVTVLNGEKDPNAIYNPNFCGQMCIQCYEPGMVTAYSLEVGKHTYSTSNGRSGTFYVFPKNQPYDPDCNTVIISNGSNIYD